MLTLVPWETTLAHSLLPHQVEMLAGGNSPRALLFRRMLQKWLEEPVSGQAVLSEPDPLALAVVVEPDIVERSETRYVEIELAGQFTRGQTVIDWYGLTDRPHNAQLVLEVDQARFVELMALGLK